MIVKKLSLGPMQTNCYILYGEEDKIGVIVDPAWSFKVIKNAIRELSLNITHIVLTHAHCDHIEALYELKEYTNAQICISENESNALNDTSLNLSSLFSVNLTPCFHDILLNDGDKICLPSFTLDIIHTPGHTSGSICLKHDNILISGDTLFYESIGRTDFPSGNFDTLYSSIKEKIYKLNPDTIVYPGHGSQTTIGHEMKYNPYIR